MKRILSVLLCLVLMLSLMGASAPVEKKSGEKEEPEICAMCEKLGCKDTKDGLPVHAKGCLCTHPVTPVKTEETAGTGAVKEPGTGTLSTESQEKKEPETCLCTCEVCLAMGKEDSTDQDEEDLSGEENSLPSGGVGGGGPEIVEESYGADSLPAGPEEKEDKTEPSADGPVQDGLDTGNTGGDGTGAPSQDTGTGSGDGAPAGGEGTGGQDAVIVTGSDPSGDPEEEEDTGAPLLSAPAPIAETGSFTVEGDSDGSKAQYAGDTLTVNDGANITISGGTATDKIKVASGASVTIKLKGVTAASIDVSDATSVILTLEGISTINNGAGYAIQLGSCLLTINGNGSLYATGTPSAFDKAPTFGFTHMTTDKDTNPLEWTGNPEAGWSTWKEVRIYPMTVEKLTVSPTDAVTQQGKDVEFTASLTVNFGDSKLNKTVSLDVTALSGTTWSVGGSTASAAAKAGVLSVPEAEDSEKLTVTAQYTADKDYTATVNVTVRLHAKSVTLDRTTAELYVGSELTLKATVDPVNSIDEVKWSVEDGKILSVDQNGKITAKKAGTTTVTATAGSKTVQCKVTVKNRDFTITFDPNGGSCNTKTMKTKADGTLESLPTATKNGMYFAHWYTSKDGGTRVTLKTVFNDNTTVYAHWSTVPVTGDENNAGLWAALLGVSAVALCVGGVYFFRKGHKKDGGAEK